MKIRSRIQSPKGLNMKAIGGIIFVLLIYMGAATIGLNIFGEGGSAAWTGVILGGIGLNWLIKNTKKMNEM